MLEHMGKIAKDSSYQLVQCSTKEKNYALQIIADLLEEKTKKILLANQKDIQVAQSNKLNNVLIDRLLLTQTRIGELAKSVRQISKLADPVGEILDKRIVANGLQLQRYRVPLGVVGVIYEARPNVTIDIACLCLKTGNAAILRGGKETIRTNTVLIQIIQEALTLTNLPSSAIQAITDPNRKYITELLKLDRYIDMLIPRGSAALHKLCHEHSTIPIIAGGIGVCHTFIDESADIDKALRILVNAKTQRPSTCNTTETVLVHHYIADTFLPKLSDIMAINNVTLHVDKNAFPLLKNGPAKIIKVTDGELREEWLSLDLNVIIVNDLYDAMNHIRKYGSAHSDAILTQSTKNAELFTRLVDSSVVYVNASTRFTDGNQFGLGAEVAVSTQKLHSRGPMGLEALTTYKWIGVGKYLCRE